MINRCSLNEYDENKKESFGVRMKNKKVVVFDGHHRIASDIISGSKDTPMKIFEHNYKKKEQKEGYTTDYRTRTTQILRKNKLN